MIHKWDEHTRELKSRIKYCNIICKMNQYKKKNLKRDMDLTHVYPEAKQATNYMANLTINIHT